MRSFKSVSRKRLGILMAAAMAMGSLPALADTQMLKGNPGGNGAAGTGANGVDGDDEVYDATNTDTGNTIAR